jgi:nucleoside-diphosphate-sugar epimerase
MQITGLGKVNVPTANTPVALSATKLMARSVAFTLDPADTTATVYVKDAAGAVIAALSAAYTPGPFEICSGGGNTLDLSKLYVDASANNKGPYACYTVR